jgi:hypothetical protein
MPKHSGPSEKDWAVYFKSEHDAKWAKKILKATRAWYNGTLSTYDLRYFVFRERDEHAKIVARCERERE